MGKLEKILKNTGKGFVVGVAPLVDPVGATIAEIDYCLVGIGPADSKRNSNTLYNNIYEKIYSDFDDSHDLSTEYVPRVVGNVLGGAGALGLGYALWTLVNPFAALALPIVSGVYSLVKGASKYGETMSKGEKIDDTYQKGSFFNGFRFGWHKNTSFLANALQPIESNLTGRGYDSSKFKGSRATQVANGSRRNFRSMMGSFFGKLVGQIANVATLGMLPLYKTIRDGRDCANWKEPAIPFKTYTPRYIRFESDLNKTKKE